MATGLCDQTCAGEPFDRVAPARGRSGTRPVVRSVLLGLLAVACRADPEPPESLEARDELPTGDGWAEALLRDPSAATEVVKRAPAGWRALFEGDLGAAAAAFEAAGDPASRLGAARAWIERAELAEELGRLVAEAQVAYLGLRRELLGELPEAAAAAERRSLSVATGVDLDRFGRALVGGTSPPRGSSSAERLAGGEEVASATTAASWLAEPTARVAIEGGAELTLFDPLRWWALGAGLRLRAARLASGPDPASLAVRAAACRGRTDGPCAERSTDDDTPEDRWWAALLGGPAPTLGGSLAGAEAAEASRVALAAALGGPNGRMGRAAGLPDVIADGALRAAARANLAEPGRDCAEALEWLRRSRDLRTPDTIGRRNRPGLFASVARAALCAGRDAEATGAARTVAAAYPEAQPASAVVGRVAVARIMRRGAMGEQKTNH